MRDTDVDRLRSIPLFCDVAEPQFWRLRDNASAEDVAGQTSLFHENESADAVYSLIVGSVELFSERQGRRCTISVIRSAKPFVLASIIRGAHAASGRTLEPTRLVRLPATLIRELLETDLDFAREAARQLAAEHQDSITDIKALRMRTTIERLAGWMLHCNDQSGNTGSFAIPYDKRTLAAYLGMAPENLSRNLAALSEAGVEVHGRQVVINDPMALALIAGCDPNETSANRPGWPTRVAVKPRDS